MKELTTAAHLMAAMAEDKNIIIYYKDGSIADYGGPIEVITENAVKVNGMYYLNAACRYYLQ
ncbi:hypothetical protein [Paenibacillus spongiae]|uniref:Uncharacterized protein n=1 Tax=Paenibacillus spongiae TaxID=2909671 RepID=A0ABY5S2N4_9BACL|nr:hypothetical protein [Paenibacillus spongiae]UVI28151.1 hypothetical protein L1F29_22195 [Paenibacillus spongiae]